MDRKSKEELVNAFRDEIKAAQVVVLAHQQGLTADETYRLRKSMRAAGANFKIVKNSLAKMAFEGTHYAKLSENLHGPIGIAYAEDPVAAAKVACEFEKALEGKFKLVAAGYGETLLSKERIKQLASLPSIDVLRAKIVGLLAAPATRLATVTRAPASALARVISAYAKA